MKFYEQIALPLLRCLEPEKAHDISITAMQSGLIPGPGRLTSDRLSIDIAGLKFPNPIGLAAGYDKNAMVIPQLMKMGFGFIEVGAVTPRPQTGNQKPRIFRLNKDLGIINRFGFNNLGMKKIKNRLERHSDRGIVGLNIGANKDSPNRAADYSQVLCFTHKHISFATINISSPNTKDLRKFHGEADLKKLLSQINIARQNLTKKLPIFLKISPDLTLTDIKIIADLSLQFGIDGIIATNTTLTRENLLSKNKDEDGGLSGRPLFERSNQILAQFSYETEGKLPLIGVGGISSAKDAFVKIKAGASIIQLYSAIIYNGFSLIEKIFYELDDIIKKEGFTHISEVVGIEKEHWL